MGYIGIIDYGAGNLMSAANTLDYLGCNSKIVTNEHLMNEASAIILPGVGAFPDAMDALENSGLYESLLKNAKKKPFLGICLGMQMLFEESDEVRRCNGLGLLNGRIEKIQTKQKLPQIGWNSLEIVNENPLLKGIKDGDYVYFVHSFMAKPQNDKDLSAVCDYGGRVPAMVAKDNIFGCQFHPEKSGDVGLKIIKNFVELSR